MHFPIIKIEPIDLAREDWDIDLDYEDSCLNENTDYYGELYSEDERMKVIRSEWLKNLLDGIATIDHKDGTITYCDKKTIQNTLYDYYVKAAAELCELAGMQRVCGYDFRKAGSMFRDSVTLFYDGYGKTALDFVEDAVYHAGETWRIGNIFDAHF